MYLRSIVVASALACAPACNVINSDLLGTGGGDAGTDAPAPDASTDQPEVGLVLHYGFDDTGTTVVDTSGRHLNGTATDATAWTANGRIGRALALTGTQFVSLPSGVLAGVDDFTIATWVKLNANTDWARLYDFGNDAGDRFMYLTVSGFALNTTINDGLHASSFGGSASNENVFATSTHLPTAVWKHVAITGSGGDRKIYIDGFPAGGITGGPVVSPREMEPTSPKSWIGKSRFADANLNGTLDDFRIYDRVLTPAELAVLAWPGHDYSVWHLDETTGTAPRDASDNAIASTLVSGTWAAGRLGGAAKLAGAPPGSSGPHLAFTTSPIAACGELTVAMWVKLGALDSSRLFDFGTGTDRYLYLAATDGVGMHLGMAMPGKGTFNLVTDAPPLSGTDDKWHHVAVTLGSGRATIYVDGVAVKSATGWSVKPSELGATTENWLGRSRAGDRFLNGSLDEVRVACRAYTADEIKNLSQP